ncbi:MAG: MBOAT family protein [Clostridia bacterium]|nr:MBOAT family protein [Clostridia bacterium]
MNFSDLFFLYAFLPLCLIVYFISPKIKYKNTVLIVFSLIFYAWGDAWALLFIILYALLNFSLGRLIELKRGKKSGTALLAAGLVLDLGMLLVFKYTGFFLENINLIFRTSARIPSMWVPLGMSFFTFRTVSYLLDIHWEKISAEKYLPDFLLFTSLFPCTVAGPIVRYSTIGSELKERTVNIDDMYQGLTRFCVGLGKKVILADNLAVVVDMFWKNGAEFVSSVDTWYAVLLYSLYVYFDFSGYSDMAIGLGRIFGFHFDENFNYPFMCKSIAEFWQRWHISLGTFFKDYLLYVPIFGKMRQYGGLFLVWFCTGMWHGASWNYIIWGLYFGVFILIETLLGKKRLKKIPLAVKHIYTKLIIVIGFGIFRFTDIRQLGGFFRSLFFFSKGGFIGKMFPTYFMNNIFLFLIALVCCFPLVPFLQKKLEGHRTAQIAVGVVWGVFCIALLLISSLLLVNATDRPFLYKQF